MTILNETPTQFFSNHINQLTKEASYYRSIAEEKEQEAEKVKSLQDKVIDWIGRAEEIFEEVATVDIRQLESVRAFLEKIFCESTVAQPRHQDQQKANLDSQRNSGLDEGGSLSGGELPSPSPQPCDGGGAASEKNSGDREKGPDKGGDREEGPDKGGDHSGGELPSPQPVDGGSAVEPENNETKAEESTNAPPVDWSNDYMTWCKTDNPQFAYFKQKQDGAVKAAFIGCNNRARLKSWETYIKNLFPGVSFEIRSKNLRLSQFKHELKIWNLTESDCKQLAQKNFDNDPEVSAPKGDSPPSPKSPIIDEKELPKGCFLKRSDDWIAIEYYVYVYERKFDPKAHGFIIDTRKIGRLIQHKNYISAWRNRASTCGEFDNTRDAINYLIATNGLSAEEIAKAYYERFPSEKETPYGMCECGTPFDIPGLDACHCPNCGWVRSDDINNQPEPTHPVAATAPESIAPESTTPYVS